MLRIGKMPVDRVPGRVMPGHHRRPAGRTDAAGHGELRERRSLCRQLVEVGSLEVLVPVTTQITPAPVIGKEKDHVRARQARW